MFLALPTRQSPRGDSSLESTSERARTEVLEATGKELGGFSATPQVEIETEPPRQEPEPAMPWHERRTTLGKAHMTHGTASLAAGPEASEVLTGQLGTMIPETTRSFTIGTAPQSSSSSFCLDSQSMAWVVKLHRAWLQRLLIEADKNTQIF